jgi:hypothetical protein
VVASTNILIVNSSSKELANRFNEVFDSFATARIQETTEWPKLFDTFHHSYIEARQQRASTTPNLNLLGVFGLRTRELCHSRVLAWFLDENASHEQGGLFLRSLLEIVRCDVSNSSNYSVQREKPDRVDLAIFKKGTFAVFIENKVNHKERDDQVWDLVNSLVEFSRKQAIPEEQRIAVFLTDDGRSPETAPPGIVPGFLDSNLFPLQRLEVFQAFRHDLSVRKVKSFLLESFLEAYIAAISNLHAYRT